MRFIIAIIQTGFIFLLSNITVDALIIGDIASPTAAQIRSAFAAVKRGDVVIAALTRGAEHRVVTLQR